MAEAVVAASLDRTTPKGLDDLVRQAAFPSRSQGIQMARDGKLARPDGSRLARECAKLDPARERELAEEGLSEGSEARPAC